MKLKSKNQLPFKLFVVKRDNTHAFREFRTWLNTEFGVDWSGDGYNYYGVEDCGGTTRINAYNTLSSFKGEIKIFDRASDFMELVKPSGDIVGYAAPYDITNYAEQGCVFTLTADKNQYKYYGCVLPKSIVERWEPVYDVDFNVGDYVYVINNGCCVNDTHDGYVGKVASIDVINNVYYKYIYVFHNGAKCSSRANCTRPATQAEIAKVITEVIVVGDFGLTITPEGIFHKTDNITNFCKEMIEYYQNTAQKFDKYTCLTLDVHFAKTGFENSPSKLSDWVMVYNTYLKLK